MKKIKPESPTEVLVSAKEAKDICGLGKGDDCCAFLAISAKGFECLRMYHPLNTQILRRIEEGTTNAKGTGGWEGCAWEGIL